LKENMSEMDWAGLALTSIKLTEVANTTNKVTFKEDDRGENEDITASFIRNLKKIGGKGSKVEYEAEVVPMKEVAKIIRANGNKPIFMAHGYNTEAHSIIEEAKKKLSSEDGALFYGGSYFIPILWPSGSGSYFRDKDDAEGAGRAFWKAFDKSPVKLPNKNLMLFSMGNYVLRYASDTSTKFDNIFMFAADVRRDLFHTSYIDTNDSFKDDGLNIFNMLETFNGKPKGKIYVVSNAGDKALLVSSTANWMSRIGKVGPHTKMNWMGRLYTDPQVTHPTIRPYLEGMDSSKDKHDGPLGHRYYFQDWAKSFCNQKIR